MSNEAKNRATTKYVAKTYKIFQFRIRKDTEADLIQWLSCKDNVNAYLKDLVKNDMLKNGND